MHVKINVKTNNSVLVIGEAGGSFHLPNSILMTVKSNRDTYKEPGTERSAVPTPVKALTDENESLIITPTKEQDMARLKAAIET